jgi:hypothetical protein
VEWRVINSPKVVMSILGPKVPDLEQLGSELDVASCRADAAEGRCMTSGRGRRRRFFGTLTPSPIYPGPMLTMILDLSIVSRLQSDPTGVSGTAGSCRNLKERYGTAHLIEFDWPFDRYA